MSRLDIFSGERQQVLSGHPVTAPISRTPDHTPPAADAQVREGDVPHLADRVLMGMHALAASVEPIMHGPGHEREVRRTGHPAILDVRVEFI